MKIGIFGGCFNPPHKKHLSIALDLIKNSYIDKVIYVPTGNTYNKRELISFNHRINMLKMLTKNLKEIEVSPIGNENDYQYTYQTLDKIKMAHRNDELYFICGTDNLEELDTWKRYTYILENYKILVIKRDNANIDNILEKYHLYKKNIIISNVKTEGVSSTMIRNLIKAKKKRKALAFLDEKVYKYIVEENLYRKEEAIWKMLLKN